MNRGVTLIELLVALVIGALVVVLASQIFISGNREFIGRSDENELMAAVIRVKSRMEKYLQREISRCDSVTGEVWIRSAEEGGEGGEFLMVDSLADILHTSSEIKCFCYRKSEIEGRTSAWEEGDQPQLIEYEVDVTKKKKHWAIMGAIIR